MGRRTHGSGRQFFLSYGRTPRLPGESREGPDGPIAQFFRDLKASVAKTARVSGPAAGFCDLEVGLQEDRVSRVERELATCRVLVPLYSERYFESARCGRELTAS
jgi:hypothetical protein